MENYFNFRRQYNNKKDFRIRFPPLHEPAQKGSLLKYTLFTGCCILGLYTTSKLGNILKDIPPVEIVEKIKPGIQLFTQEDLKDKLTEEEYERIFGKD